MGLNSKCGIMTKSFAQRQQQTTTTTTSIKTALLRVEKQQTHAQMERAKNANKGIIIELDVFVLANRAQM